MAASSRRRTENGPKFPRGVMAIALKFLVPPISHAHLATPPAHIRAPSWPAFRRPQFIVWGLYPVMDPRDAAAVQALAAFRSLLESQRSLMEKQEMALEALTDFLRRDAEGGEWAAWDVTAAPFGGHLEVEVLRLDILISSLASTSSHGPTPIPTPVPTAGPKKRGRTPTIAVDIIPPPISPASPIVNILPDPAPLEAVIKRGRRGRKRVKKVDAEACDVPNPVDVAILNAVTPCAPVERGRGRKKVVEEEADAETEKERENVASVAVDDATPARCGKGRKKAADVDGDEVTVDISEAPMPCGRVRKKIPSDIADVAAFALATPPASEPSDVNVRVTRSRGRKSAVAVAEAEKNAEVDVPTPNRRRPPKPIDTLAGHADVDVGSGAPKLKRARQPSAAAGHVIPLAIDDANAEVVLPKPKRGRLSKGLDSPTVEPSTSPAVAPAAAVMAVTRRGHGRKRSVRGVRGGRGRGRGGGGRRGLGGAVTRAGGRGRGSKAVTANFESDDEWDGEEDEDESGDEMEEDDQSGEEEDCRINLSN
ncbi:hypothetical protein HK101_005775 [Irineochytrium annulatum]|nr:hypothetical protein HK101_005775 [Irineochytrium annulatum]